MKIRLNREKKKLSDLYRRKKTKTKTPILTKNKRKHIRIDERISKKTQTVKEKKQLCIVIDFDKKTEEDVKIFPASL